MVIEDRSSSAASFSLPFPRTRAKEVVLVIGWRTGVDAGGEDGDRRRGRSDDREMGLGLVLD